MNFFDIMHDVDFCLLGSIGQVASDAKSLELWTDSSMDKTDLWLKGANPELEKEFKDLPHTAKAFAEWMQKHCPGTDPNGINQWSSALVLELQMLITKYDNGSDWNAVVGAVGPFSSMISSAMTQDTTTANAQQKNMQSQLQTDNTALQPIADMGSTWSQNLSSLANALAQMSPT